MSRLRYTLWVLALPLVVGLAQAEPDPSAVSDVSLAQAPQLFLDAFRAQDEDTMRAIAAAPHLDAFRIADALLQSHVNGVLAEPPAPGDYGAALAALSERAGANPRGAGLPRLVAAWGALDEAALRRAERLGRARHAASAAYGTGDDARVLRVVESVEEDIHADDMSVSAAFLRTLRARTHRRARRWSLARAGFLELVSSSRRLGWLRNVAHCLDGASYCALMQYDNRRARDLTLRAVALYRELELRADLTRAEGNLTGLYLRTGQPAAARALATRLRGLYAAAGKPAQAAKQLLSMASAAALQGDHQEAVDLCRTAAGEFTDLGDARSAAMAIVIMGSTLSDAGRHAEALGAFDAALATLGDGDAVDVRASVALNRGVAHRRLGMLLEARRSQEEARSLYARAKDQRGAAHARANLAVLHFEEEEYSSAAAVWQEQLAYWRRAGDLCESGKTAANLSIVYRKLDRLGDSEDAAAAALAQFRTCGNAELAAHAETQLAEIALLGGNFARAERFASRALEGFAATGSSNRIEVQAHRVLARIHLNGDAPEAALASLRRAREIEAVLGQGLGEHTGLGLRSRARLTSDLGVAAALRLSEGAPEKAAVALGAAYAFAEAGRGLLLAEQLANADALRGRHLPPDLLEADALTRSDVAAARAELVRNMATPNAAPEAILAARTALAEAWKRREETVSRMQRQARRVTDLVYPEPAPIETVREYLAAGTALVMYHVAGEKLVALVVTPEGGRLHDLGASDEIVGAVRKYLRLIASPGSPEEKLAGLLYDRLLAPLVESLGECTRLVLCPDDVLAFLPWAALRMEEGRGGTRVVERWETVLVPSATVFVALAEEATGAPDAVALLALGNPTYPATSPPGGGALFPPLPASAKEVEAIARLFPEAARRILLGGNASVAALETALEGVEGRLRSLHLACHAFVDDGNPRLSTLVLANAELLDLDTVYRLRIPADLVVLSACASARSQVVRGEGALGFVRGFLFSGARRVVASNWKVSDDSTGVLMTRFYESLIRDGEPPAAALRTAQLRSMRSAGPEAHPHHWAAFTLWGPPE